MNSYTVVNKSTLAIAGIVIFILGAFSGSWFQNESLVQSNIELHKLLEECRSN